MKTLAEGLKIVINDKDFEFEFRDFVFCYKMLFFYKNIVKITFYEIGRQGKK